MIVLDRSLARQPTGFREVNKSCPISDGLTHLWTPTSGANSVTGEPAKYLSGGNWEQRASHKGMATRIVTPRKGICFTDSAERINARNPWTVFAIMAFRPDLSGLGDSFVGTGDTGGDLMSGARDRGIGFSFVTPNIFALGHLFDGANKRSTSSVPITYSAGVVIAAIVVSAGAGILRTFYNGEPAASTAISNNGFAAYANAFFTIGGAGTNYEYLCAGRVDGFAWGAVEAARFADNPWQLFAPRRLYFNVPAGAATVSADGVLRWSLNALAQRDTTLMWSLLQTAQRDATARWSLISAINADATLRYSLVQAVQADAALRWSMLEAVSADTTLLWDMAGATGIVSRDFAARWSLLAPVSADAAFHWSLLQAVARDQALPWSMVQAISADAALRWSLIQAVQADADIAWSLLQAVSADAVLAWELAASLGTVAASLSLRWSLIAAVQQSIDARWSLLASVGADADMRWDMLTSLTAELLARWNIIGRAVADAPLHWDLIAVSATDLVIRWQVGEVFDLVVRKRFVSGASMRRSFVV